MLSHMCVIVSVGIKPRDFTVLELFYLIFAGRLFSTGVSRHLSACDGEAAVAAAVVAAAVAASLPLYRVVGGRMGGLTTHHHKRSTQPPRRVRGCGVVRRL